MRNVIAAGLLIVLTLGAGCQQMKKILNPEPVKTTTAAPAKKSSSKDWVFGGSRELPSNLDSKLSPTEREALRSTEQERNMTKQYRFRTEQEDKAASSWVFGR